MPATRKVFLGGVAACAVALTAFSVAWACSPGGGISVEPGGGPAGSTVVVSGSGFETTAAGGNGPVQIRWNSMSGPVLATANGPDFSVNVGIPETAQSRTYYVVAVQELATGATRTAPDSFQVTSSAFDPPPAPAPTELQPEAQPPPQPAPPAATADPAAAPAPVDVGRSPSTRSTASATRTVRRPVAPAPPARATPAVQAPQPAPAPVVDPANVAQLPSGRTVSSDVWSGFGDKDTSRGPSLVDTTSPSKGSGAAGDLGLGLVALGTVGLVGGTLVAVRTRRRPVAAEASTE